MSGSSSGSKRSNKSGTKEDSKGYTGDEELREFTFTIRMANAQGRFLKARNGIAEMVGRKMGDDIYQLMKYGKEADFKEPSEPTGERLTYGQQKKYELEYRAYLEETRQYKKNKGRLFRMIAGQCVPVLRTRLEASTKFKDMEEKHDVVSLMEMIEGLVYNSGKGEYPYWTMATNVRKVAELRQGKKESIESFAIRFIAQMENAEKVSGKWIPSNMKGKKLEEQEEGRNKLLACLFLGGCDRDRFKDVVDELYHDFGKGDNKYPEDITGVTELLNGRRGGSKMKDQEDNRHDGLITSFVQRDGRTMRCYNCHRTGHYARDCTMRVDELTQRTGGIINIDGNAHASAFQMTRESEDESQSSNDSVQDRADEWNSYYFLLVVLLNT